MTEVNGRIYVWADHLRPWFDGLIRELERSLEIRTLALDSEPGQMDGATVLLVLTGEPGEAGAGLEWLRTLGSETMIHVIVVIYDGHLGSDRDRARSQVSGAAIACVRSLAVERGTSVRANVICLPETIAGATTELRGPLPQIPTVDDLVEAVNFFAGADGGYLSGQVLYLNSGRHLFSSHTA